ncbi:zinc dependent phospholipase C family protein [Flavobacterium cellulosilyticum]|uniref:S1/P1 Nuclease n=1 Tax=Flavobacterium cellulosilyticum TaxID=2541731 RepID=A0A4R5CDB0_9FLAO|nr:zinc dependent phospholipase C family protein [Flavobacterium cellulosilyticum]TDD96280.1 S1/P1 Nuclease [Flavobacterium cellulosilyticum]
MKKFKLKPIFITISIISISFVTISWGIVGHEYINKAAVMVLPKPMLTFFYNHIDFITQESTVPDIRKYSLNYKEENPRHFFDMENFGSQDSLPKTLAEANKKYDSKFLLNNGILPWFIDEMMVKLTKAFKEKNRAEILFLAADLGHYIGDAHMPLHTSVNYDGQLTEQKGIHALWESRIPELFVNNYKFTVAPPQYIENISLHTWKIINDSHSLATPLLSADKQLRTTTKENNIFVVDAQGAIVKNKYNAAKFSDDYTSRLNIALNGMVESQMKKAVTETASYWYTAWVNAGKPDLSDLDGPELTKRNSKSLKKDLKLFMKGNLFGFKNQED